MRSARTTSKQDDDPHERVVVYVPASLHRQLKDWLAAQGTTVSGWFRRKAQEEVSRKH